MKVYKLTAKDLERKLSHFEEKYGMRSSDFYTKYNLGQLDHESAEFVLWASYYDMAARAGLVELGARV